MAAEQQQVEETPEAPPPRRDRAGVGALLKASRLRVGEDLRDIAGILRIRYVYMEAIEDGRYEALPGPTYAAGFIRAYAEHLGLDSEEVVRRFKAEGTAGREAADLVFPEPIPEPGIPGGAVILVGIVVAVVAYGAWYVNTSEDGFLAELVSPLPDRLANLVEGEGRPSGQTSPAATPEPTPEAKTEPAPEPTPQATPEPAPEPATPTSQPQGESTAASAPAQTAEPTPEPAPEPTPEPETAAAPVAEPAPTETTAAPPEAAAGAEAPQPAAAATEAASTAEPAPVRRVPGSETTAATPAGQPAATASETPAAPEPVPESRETPVATTRPPAPAEPIEPVIAPGNVPVDMIPPARPATTTTPTAAPPETLTPTPTETTTAATPAAAPTPAAEPAPTATAEPSVAATQTGEAGSRILVRAKVNSWIQVRDETAGELLVTRLLRSGDSYAVPNRSGLRLSTGNAGALEILVDGEVVPAIGDDGAVRRNVLLDAEKLKAGQAVSE